MRQRIEDRTGNSLEQSYTGLTVSLLLAIPTLDEDDSRPAKKRRMM